MLLPVYLKRGVFSLVAKKKLLILCFLLSVMLFLGGFLDSSSVYAYYTRGTTITSDDVRAIMTAVGMTVPGNTRVNNYRDTINGLINNLYTNYTDFNLCNMLFYYYNNSLYVVIQNGTIGTSFDYVCVHYTGTSTVLSRYISTIYSGDEIVRFSEDQLTNVYKITETSYSLDTNNTYPTWSYSVVPFTSGDKIVTVPQIAPVWNYNSVASWIGAAGVNTDTSDWRFLGNSVQLSGWTAPTSTPTPTPTSTPTPAGGGGTDLTDTNNKIDTVNSSVQEVKDVISGEAQEIKELISGETQEVISAITSPADFSGETITSGDIENSLGFEIMHDPYENFWLTLIIGLDDCLTDSVRSITFTFFNKQYTIDLDVYNWNPPQSLTWLLEMISTYAIILFILKYWKSLIDMLQSGSVDEVLQLNEEEGIVDMF